MAEDPLELTEDDWQRTMSVDLEGVWWLIREVLPHMLDRGGAVINIASTHSFLVVPGCFPYPVAKHALVGLTKALAAEFAARGVRINAIAPAYIDTDMVVGYLDSTDDPVAERARVNGLHPVGRMGQPEEVAGPALFLASDDASFISGEVLMVDGGITTIYNGHGNPFVPGKGPTLQRSAGVERVIPSQSSLRSHCRVPPDWAGSIDELPLSPCADRAISTAPGRFRASDRRGSC